MKDVNTVRTALLEALPAGTPTSELVMAQIARAAELSVLAARLRHSSPRADYSHGSRDAIASKSPLPTCRPAWSTSLSEQTTTSGRASARS